jgi:hypothetical protein
MNALGVVDFWGNPMIVLIKDVLGTIGVNLRCHVHDVRSKGRISVRQKWFYPVTLDPRHFCLGGLDGSTIQLR